MGNGEWGIGKRIASPIHTKSAYSTPVIFSLSFLSFPYCNHAYCLCRYIKFDNYLPPCNLLSCLLPSASCLLPYCHQSVSDQPNLILGAH
ncbi:MAG: hypothetical protein F6K47_23530 [Symploca sp. SIO2E6]|nr:hypothetical protein [Symploca sp. SIO2E6]